VTQIPTPSLQMTTTTVTSIKSPGVSSGQCSLENAVINLSALRDHAKKELIEILNSTGGKKRKALIIEQPLVGLLSLIVEMSVLVDLGVEKCYVLASGQLDVPQQHLIYICRPHVKFVRNIAEQIRDHKSAGQGNKTYSIIFVPRRTLLCERAIDEFDIQNVSTWEYHLDLVPFDDDVLSMELSTVYKECCLDGDRTTLLYIARALIKLQSLFGIIPNIRGKGNLSLGVAELMLKLRHTEMSTSELPAIPEIDTLVLIDRTVDFVTPLCTQLTYEGLIDEVFGINNTTIDLPEEKLVDPKVLNKEKIKPGAKKKFALNSDDKIYQEIRDLNLRAVSPFLNKKAKAIDQYYKDRHKAQTVSQLKDYLEKLKTFQKKHQYLSIHTSITEEILNVTKEPEFRAKLDAEQNLLAGSDVEVSESYIEDCIGRQEPLVKVLRLLCLYSLTVGGVKDKQYQHFANELIQTYGYQYLFTLDNLAKLGLFKRQSDSRDPTFPFSRLRKEFRLIVPNIDEETPKDIAYVYSGYAPLSVRLIELLCLQSERLSAFSQDSSTGVANGNVDNERADKIVPGWGSTRLDEILKLIPGPTFTVRQTLPQGLKSDKGPASLGPQKNSVTLVFFVGGCTFTEISAIRFLRQQNEGRDFIVATTKLINGNTFLESVIEDLEAKET